MEGENSKGVITTSALMQLFDCSHTQIARLIDAGVIQKTERGKFNTAETINRYIKYLRDKLKHGNVDETDYHKEKTLHERAKRLGEEMKLKKAYGQVYPADLIKFAVLSMTNTAKRQLLNIPTKTAPELEGKTASQISQHLKHEITEVLKDLQEYDFEDVMAESVEDGDGESYEFEENPEG